MAGITVVGGANLDLQGFPDEDLRLSDSNPGSINMTAGGVGRNIAENIMRLGYPVSFLSAFGDDTWGRYLLEGLETLGVDVSPSMMVPGGRTSIYLCVLDRARALHVAVADMKILEALSPGALAERGAVLRESELCVVDANLSQATLQTLVELCGTVPVVLDTVSVAKAVRARECIGRFYAVKPNEGELEVLTGMTLRSELDLDRAVDELHRRGTQQVFVSRGARGLYFSDGEHRGTAQAPAPRTANVSGAGDALTAALAVGTAGHLPIEQTAAFAAAAAALTTEVLGTVDTGLTRARVSRLAAAVRISKRSSR